MLRSRIAAAAVGATVLGLSAALVPTVSTAASDSAPTAATPIVGWADGADDFTALDAEAENPVVPGGWSWFGIEGDQADTATSLDQVASFGTDGISAKDDSAVYLVRGLTKTVTPDALPAVIADASANAGESTVVGLLLASEDEPTTVTNTAFAVSGLDGADTTWAYEDSGEESTDAFAADLADNDEVVFGYLVVLAGSDFATGIEDPSTDEPTTPPTEEPTPAPTTEPTAEPTVAPTTAPTTEPAPTVTPAPTATPSAPSFLQRVLPSERVGTAASSLKVAGSAAAVTPSEAGIASFAVDDTTTYFTPRPTASASLESGTSATITAATTVGIRVLGHGFAPFETVKTSIAQGDRGIFIPGSTSVADQDGNVVITVIVPAAFPLTPSDYLLSLVGESSAQTGDFTLTLTADPAVAPVATPVSGRATFTG